MIENLLYQVSRTAAAAMVLTALCCLCTGLIAILLTHMPGESRAERAGRVTRVLATFGAGTALTAGLTGIPYRWLIGQIDFETFLIVEVGLAVMFAVWVGAVAGLLPTGRLGSR